MEIDRHDPLGPLAPMVELGPGEFVAEIGQLSGRPALVDARAKTELKALVIPPHGLRAVLISEPEIGDRVMRALILRRVVLIETGTGGPVLIGPRESGDMIRLQGSLTRNAYPFQVLAPAEDPDAASLVERYAKMPEDLPLAVCPKGTILKNPSEGDLAKALDMVPNDVGRRSYDVAIEARDRPGSRQPSTRLRRAFPWSFSTRERSAAKLAPARASRTTSASQPELQVSP